MILACFLVFAVVLLVHFPFVSFFSIHFKCTTVFLRFEPVFQKREYRATDKGPESCTVSSCVNNSC